MTLPVCLLAFLLAAEPAKNPFDFADGDRVVLLGSTLIEREQKYGAWELALTLLNKDKNVTFRNLGWSGDTVWCESRGSFDGPKAGFDRTVALVKELKPTVIVLCYGQVESFDGPDGVSKFTEGYGKLLDVLAPTKARFVLMTPTPFEDRAPLKDAARRNESLKKYNDVTKELAAARKADVFDLFARGDSFPAVLDRTDNGIHQTEDGYWYTATLFGPDLKLNTLTEFGATPLRPAVKEGVKQRSDFRVIVPRTPEQHKLLGAINAKNELFFHRWRPQNVTYLTGFRKKEQGQNAKEIAEFDPLIQQAEKDIQKLLKKIN